MIKGTSDTGFGSTTTETTSGIRCLMKVDSNLNKADMQEKFTITCPNCGKPMALDETLAGPLIAKIKDDAHQLVIETKREAEQKIQALAEQEELIAKKEKELSGREASINSAVNQAIAAERLQIIQTERENLRKDLAMELEVEKKKADELAIQLETSQKAELALRLEKDTLEQRAKALDLEVQRKVDEQRKVIREQAYKDAEEQTRLRLAEKDKTISDMQVKLEEAQRKAYQGSQQLQGEVLEQDFESSLRQFFPQDTVESVKSGARGGDVLQRVFGRMGRSIGTILWETKRAQSWSGDWAAKAKHDAANSKAEIAIIVSEVLPNGIQDFGPYEGIWVARQSHAIVLGIALRQGIIATAEARQSVEGKESKMERLYNYMTGKEFRSIIEGIALPFREIHEELSAEKRATLARWKRQERRIERVLVNVAGLEGDLKGIAGSEMPELPGFGEAQESEEPGTESLGLLE